jgi:hypothetical protein
MIWFQSFTSKQRTEQPHVTNEKAKAFANKVIDVDPEMGCNRIINIVLVIGDWGNYVTVWYEADREVAV